MTAGPTAAGTLHLLLPAQVALPHSLVLAGSLVPILGQQAGAQALQARGEGHLHVHIPPSGLGWLLQRQAEQLSICSDLAGMATRLLSRCSRDCLYKDAPVLTP